MTAWLTAEGWHAYEAAGCSSPGQKFECLAEGLVGVAAAVLVGPVLLWLAYRWAGLRRPLLSVPVAVLLAWSLLSLLPGLVVQVRLLAGAGRPFTELSGPGTALLLGLAALGGGLALQGPHRVVRGAVAVVALAALAWTVAVLAGPAERADLRRELAGAEVPLLLPGPGWQVDSVSVDGEGGLSYDVVPVGFDGHGWEGVPVQVDAGPGGFGATCTYRACTDVGDVRLELPVPGDRGRPVAWRVVDGATVTLGRYDTADGVELDPVPFLGRMAPATAEQVLARRFVGPG